MKGGEHGADVIRYRQKRPHRNVHQPLRRRRQVLWTASPIRRRSGNRPLPPARKPDHNEVRAAAGAAIADRETAAIQGMPRINDPDMSDSPVDVRGIMR
jgi:hypothetical protein